LSDPINQHHRKSGFTPICSSNSGNRREDALPTGDHGKIKLQFKTHSLLPPLFR